MDEVMQLFQAYLAVKGKKAIRYEWLECKGPWFSIRVRNTLGVRALQKRRGCK